MLNRGLIAPLVAAALSVTGATAAPLTFVVIGDAPYGAEDEAMLEEAIPKIAELKPPFVIHVGDFKGGKQPCLREYDDRFARLLKDLAPIPVFYTPGDNEWTDCDRNIDPESGAKYSELARLDVLRRRFHSGPAAGGKAFEAQRQAGQPENQTWFFDDVRFATLSVVGTDDGRSYVQGDPLDVAQAAVAARQAKNAEWLARAADLAKREDARALIFAMQADPTGAERKFRGKRCKGVYENVAPCDAFLDLRRQFAEAARAFGGPTLVIHGDTEAFTLNQEFLGASGAHLWRLNAAGDSGIGVTGLAYGIRDATKVTVTNDRSRPFAAEGLLTGRAPKARE